MMQDKELRMTYNALIQDQLNKVYTSRIKSKKKTSNWEMVFTPLSQQVCLLNDVMLLIIMKMKIIIKMNHIDKI